jgi:hypothetical protein
MALPSYPPRLHYSNYTCEEYKSRSSSLCSFLYSPVALFLFGPNILLSTPFLNTLSLCFSLNVRDQVSHPYRTRGKIIVLYLYRLYILWWKMAIRRMDLMFPRQWSYKLICSGIVQSSSSSMTFPRDVLHPYSGRRIRLTSNQIELRSKQKIALTLLLLICCLHLKKYIFIA